MYTSSYVEEFGPSVLARQSVTCGAPESIVIGSPFVTRVGTPNIAKSAPMDKAKDRKPNTKQEKPGIFFFFAKMGLGSGRSKDRPHLII